MFHGCRLSSWWLAWCITMLLTPGLVSGLRCYVCGGHSGTPCRGGMGDTEPLEDGVKVQDPVQECTDLINNRGCVKQFVNGVVLLRGCWLDGTNKCLKNGAAEVCTCSTDLCNSAPSHRTSTVLPSMISLLSLLISLVYKYYATNFLIL